MDILELIQGETKTDFAKRGSKEYHGRCPFCRCESNSFVVFVTGEERYWCRNCDAKGDAIQFLRDYKGVDFLEAKQILGVESGIQSNHHHNHNHHHHHHHHHHHYALTSPSEVWVAQAQKFVTACQAALWDERGAKALEWLRTARGLTEKTIRDAALGFNDKDWYANRQEWGLPEEKDDKGRSKGLWLPKGVVIPWAIDGALWGVRIRRPPTPGDKLKYYWLPGGTPNALYGADLVLPGKPVALFEGEIDALSVAQAAGDQVAAVATGSTHGARRPKWVARLSTVSVVLVCYDNDEAGENASQHWIDALPNAKRWRPYWADANDMAKDGVDLCAWVGAGLPVEQPAPAQPQPQPPAIPTTIKIERIYLGSIHSPKFGKCEVVEVNLADWEGYTEVLHPKQSVAKELVQP